MKFYIMYSQSCVEEYVIPGDELNILRKGCKYSEFQFLDHSSMTVEVSEDGGLEFPDFLIHREVIPLISENFRQVLDRLGIDNLFYKPITLTNSSTGESESYFLSLPPRINCLNRSASKISIEEQKVVEIVIDERLVGNYKIFKLPSEFANQEIIVTEEVKSAVEAAELENVFFAELGDVD